ncbi:MAG TPA: hypothetical protein VII63_08455 [Caulobacteraceae bacterium]
MTAYNTTNYNNRQGAATGHGPYQGTTHLHATSPALPASLATGDSVNVGYLPAGAIVTGAILKAGSQLDSNGSPTLTLDLGVAGSTQLFKAAVTTVGRAAGASADVTLAGAGALYKNLTGAQVAVIATVHAGAATGVAGALEVDVEYYVEDAVGSPA